MPSYPTAAKLTVAVAAEFAVVAAVDVDLDDDGPLAGAKDPGHGPRGPVADLDRPQIADEEIRGGDGVAERRGPAASWPAVTSAIVAISPPCSPPAVFVTRSSTGISMTTVSSVDGTSCKSDLVEQLPQRFRRRHENDITGAGERLVCSGHG